MATLSERLIQLKVDRNLFQKKIAEDLGISVRSYQRYESGERKPDSDTIIKLCKYFNISANYILGLSNNPEPLYIKENK